MPAPLLQNIYGIYFESVAVELVVDNYHDCLTPFDSFLMKMLAFGGFSENFLDDISNTTQLPVALWSTVEIHKPAYIIL